MQLTVMLFEYVLITTFSLYRPKQNVSLKNSLYLLTKQELNWMNKYNNDELDKNGTINALTLTSISRNYFGFQV